MFGTDVRALAIAASLLLILPACGSDDEAAPTPATTAAAADTTALFGRYEREVTQADIDRTAAKRAEGQEVPAPGRHRLVVNQGVMQVFLPDGFQISLELTVEGDTWRIGRYTGGQGVFCTDSGPATYTWKLDDDELTLTATSDACADRDSTLTGVWTKTE